MGQSSDHQRSVEQLTLDFQSRLETLEEQKSLEAMALAEEMDDFWGPIWGEEMMALWQMCFVQNFGLVVQGLHIRDLRCSSVKRSVPF